MSTKKTIAELLRTKDERVEAVVRVLYDHCGGADELARRVHRRATMGLAPSDNIAEVVLELDGNVVWSGRWEMRGAEHVGEHHIAESLTWIERIESGPKELREAIRATFPDRPPRLA